MRRYILSIFTLLLSGCIPLHKRHRIVVSSQKIESYATKPKTAATPPPVTIWIHGTCIVSDKILHKLCSSPSGFTKVSSIGDDFQVHKVARMLSGLDPSRFNFDHYYTFGWSGKLSFAERKKAAQDLYEHLKKLTNEYQKNHGTTPAIRIITHSHGGNVALNLASVYNPDDDIKIEELILLACPIQHETAHKAESPLFKKIYSLFSTLDAIQILDPQGWQKWDTKTLPKDVSHQYCLLSGRCFKLIPKIKQIQVKMHGRGIFHVEFLLTKFLKLLPALLHQIDQLDPQDTRIKLMHIKG